MIIHHVIPGHLVGLGSLGEQIMEANPRFSPSVSVLCKPFEPSRPSRQPYIPWALLSVVISSKLLLILIRVPGFYNIRTGSSF